MPYWACSGRCIGNGNETISLCWMMLCGEGLVRAVNASHNLTEMSAASLSVKCLLRGNQRDTKSMFIVLELRKCCSLQKEDDHFEATIRCYLHYCTLMSAIYQNITGEQF